MSNAIQSAQAAIDAHQATMRLEEGATKATDLWHLIYSLLEWCYANGVDFDAIVSEVRCERID